ncbi:MAG: DUF2628 domain-containing protein [Clostridia bacterium]|nr:DUF2628 domain-containing protein [Clostridia bacterium]
MKYECLPCPVCGSIFGENDDVVVCPKCGTPHHRNCFAESGSCANADKHKEGFVWVSPLVDIPQAPKATPTPTESVNTNKTKIFSNEAFPFNEDELMKMGGLRPIDGEELIGDLKVMEYGEYIGKNKHKYIPKFYRMGRANQKVSWNWAAFFFPIPWLFYRKMNAIGSILAIFTFIIPIVFTMDVINYNQEFSAVVAQASATITPSELLALFPQPPLSFKVSSYISFAVNLFCAFFGNYFYMKKATKEIKDIKADKQNFSEYEVALKKKGSVSISNMIIWIFLFYFLENIAFVISTKTGLDISMYIEKAIMYFQK